MKRYYISPIIGDGTSQNPYRASVADVSQTNTNTIIPSKPDGTPKYGFAFCIIGTLNPTGTAQVTNSLTFPDYPLDGRMDGMEAVTRAAFKQSAEAYDLDGNGLNLDMTFYGDSSSYRDVIDGIGKQFEPVFNVNNFDVGEPQE